MVYIYCVSSNLSFGDVDVIASKLVVLIHKLGGGGLKWYSKFFIL